MGSTELKPCPFCGGKPVLLKHNDEDYYKVFCEWCGARQWTFANRTDKDAIRNWNTRKPMDNIVAELESRKELLNMAKISSTQKNVGQNAYNIAIDIVKAGGVE